MAVKKNAKSLLAGVSVSTPACMLMKIQGNIIGLTVRHLIIAAQTGLIAGSMATGTEGHR